MSSSDTAYSLDLLFKTEKADEPGSMRVRVMKPRAAMRITVVVEPTSAAPVRPNIASIAGVVQTEILGRIQTDITNAKDAQMFLQVNDHCRAEFPNDECLRFVFSSSDTAACTLEPAARIEY